MEVAVLPGTSYLPVEDHSILAEVVHCNIRHHSHAIARIAVDHCKDQHRMLEVALEGSRWVAVLEVVRTCRPFCVVVLRKDEGSRADGI